MTLPNLTATLEVASATDSGMVRSHNEDSIATDAEIGLVVLADGMGGYNAGEVASGIAVAMMKSDIRSKLGGRKPHQKEATGELTAVRLLRESLAKANTSIYQAAKDQPKYSGMGTTVVSALFFDNSVAVGHVGDSRLYRLRGEVFGQITRDHSLLQEQIDSGLITKEQARYSQNKNLVTRAVGIDPHVEMEIHTYKVEPGDIYLLCSDGLSDMVMDEDIQQALEMLRSNLPLAARQLVQMANDNGGRDNISVVLVRILGDYAAPSGWVAKFRAWFG